MMQHLVYEAHGWCLRWNWAMILPTVIADAMIAFAYFSIPAAIFVYLWKQQLRLPLLEAHILIAFIIFIFLCGLTHVMDIVVVFYPYYGLNRAVRVATAIASLVTATTLWPSLTFLVAKHRGQTNT